MIAEWCRKYIGLPFADKGRGPAFDCWGLVLHVYKEEFNVNLPNFDNAYTDCNPKQSADEIAEIYNGELANWLTIPRGEEQIGDVIMMRYHRTPMHAGIVAGVDGKGDPKMLHIEEVIGSVLENYHGPNWYHRIVSFHRRRELA